MSTISVLLLVGVAVTGGCAVSLAVDARRIRRELLPDIRKILLSAQRTSPVTGASMFPASHDGHGLAPWGAGVFVVWEWRDGEWMLSTGLEQPGVHPGPPPRERGAFRGDKRKTWVPTAQR